LTFSQMATWRRRRPFRNTQQQQQQQQQAEEEKEEKDGPRLEQRLFTTEDLTKRIQASDKQLHESLHKLKAVELNGNENGTCKQRRHYDVTGVWWYQSRVLHTKAPSLSLDERGRQVCMSSHFVCCVLCVVCCVLCGVCCVLCVVCF